LVESRSSTGAGGHRDQLTRGGVVSGLFTEEGSRQAVQWGNIGLQIQGAPESGGNVGGWGQSDANGRFQVTGLASGTYLLTATTPQGMQVEDEVRVVTGQTTDVNLAARRFGAVVVKVVDASGQAVVGATVMLVSSRGNQLNPNWDLLRREGKVDFSKPDVWQALMTTDEAGVNRRWHVRAATVKVVARGKPSRRRRRRRRARRPSSTWAATRRRRSRSVAGSGGGGDGGWGCRPGRPREIRRPFGLRCAPWAQPPAHVRECPRAVLHGRGTLFLRSRRWPAGERSRPRSGAPLRRTGRDVRPTRAGAILLGRRNACCAARRRVGADRQAKGRTAGR
jgi:hypothetical protein